ncbi:hypothetical protein [Profundibacter sp.]
MEQATHINRAGWRKISLIALVITIAGGQAAFAECDILEGGFKEKAEQRITLSPTVEASLVQLAGENLVYISENGETVFSGDFGEAGWNGTSETGMPQVIAVDVNKDGIKDLFVGVGQGMVNNYYMGMVSQPDGQWSQNVEVSNPAFSCGEQGFTGWYRSGPRGTDEVWAIGKGGLPYVQISRTVVDDHVFQKVIYDAQGKVITRSIVPYTEDIRIETAPVTAKAVEGAAVYSPDDMQTELARLAADVPLVLLEADDTYSLMLVEFGPDRKRGWVAIEDVAYE